MKKYNIGYAIGTVLGLTVGGYLYDKYMRPKNAPVNSNETKLTN